MMAVLCQQINLRCTYQSTIRTSSAADGDPDADVIDQDTSSATAIHPPGGANTSSSTPKGTVLVPLRHEESVPLLVQSAFAPSFRAMSLYTPVIKRFGELNGCCLTIRHDALACSP